MRTRQWSSILGSPPSLTLGATGGAKRKAGLLAPRGLGGLGSEPEPRRSHGARISASQAPPHRIGYAVPSLPQLKIFQKIIRLDVLVPFDSTCIGSAPPQASRSGNALYSARRALRCASPH